MNPAAGNVIGTAGLNWSDVVGLQKKIFQRNINLQADTTRVGAGGTKLKLGLQKPFVLPGSKMRGCRFPG